MDAQQQPTITIDIVSILYFRKIVTNDGRIHCQVFDRNQARDALRALLHAILFHRLFGIVKPQKFDVLDVTFVWSNISFYD